MRGLRSEEKRTKRQAAYSDERCKEKDELKESEGLVNRDVVGGK